jgi:hypothetical protein
MINFSPLMYGMNSTHDISILHTLLSVSAVRGIWIFQNKSKESFIIDQIDQFFSVDVRCEFYSGCEFTSPCIKCCAGEKELNIL